MWCVAELDEEYIARMEEVLAVYEKPLSEQEPVVCVDEKPVVLHQDVQPRLANTSCSPEFADYLLEIAVRYPEADTIHLVLNNLSSHTRKAVVERFGEKAGSWLWDRFTMHYTPKHGSWLNQAEIAISCFRGNAWANAGLQIATLCEKKLVPGAVV